MKMSSTAQLRKIKKPMIERRRRERINDCLQQLKNIILNFESKEPSRYSKMEKADILEMTVKHLKEMHLNFVNCARLSPPTNPQSHHAMVECCPPNSSLGDMDSVSSPSPRSSPGSHLSHSPERSNLDTSSLDDTAADQIEDRRFYVHGFTEGSRQVKQYLSSRPDVPSNAQEALSRHLHRCIGLPDAAYNKRSNFIPNSDIANSDGRIFSTVSDSDRVCFGLVSANFLPNKLLNIKNEDEFVSQINCAGYSALDFKSRVWNDSNSFHPSMLLNQLRLLSSESTISKHAGSANIHPNVNIYNGSEYPVEFSSVQHPIQVLLSQNQFNSPVKHSCVSEERDLNNNIISTADVLPSTRPDAADSPNSGIHCHGPKYLSHGVPTSGIVYGSSVKNLRLGSCQPVAKVAQTLETWRPWMTVVKSGQ